MKNILWQNSLVAFFLVALPVVAQPVAPSVSLVIHAIERYVRSDESTDVVKALIVSPVELIPRQLAPPLYITSHKRGYIEGNTIFSIKYKTTKQNWASFQITADIQRYCDVLVLQRNVSAGEQITADDVTVEQRQVTWSRREKPVNVAFITGKRTTRMLQVGRILFESMFEPVPAVQRGQNVTMIVYSKNVSISMPAQVCQDAVVGEEVRVKVNYKTTDKYFTARVKDAATVVVLL